MRDSVRAIYIKGDNPKLSSRNVCKIIQDV